MALKPCKECGAPVSDEAKACPQCGAKLQPKTTKVVWFAAIAMFVVVLPQCFMDKAEEATQPVLVEKPVKQPNFDAAGGTNLDSEKLVICTASAMKSTDIKKYKLWFDTLAVRYQSALPEKTNAEIEQIAINAMLAEEKILQQQGVVGKNSFKIHYKNNCQNFEPDQSKKDKSDNQPIFPSAKKTSLGVVELGDCTAIAQSVSSARKLSIWRDSLAIRYQQINPKWSSAQVELYLIERLADKARHLESLGVDSSAKKARYYQENCAEFEPS